MITVNILKELCLVRLLNAFERICNIVSYIIHLNFKLWLTIYLKEKEE